MEVSILIDKVAVHEGVCDTGAYGEAGVWGPRALRVLACVGDQLLRGGEDGVGGQLQHCKVL